MTPFAETSHRRFNALNREWVLVSPQRTERPWQGQIERPAQPAALRHDPECYLCPGNSRAHGEVNPDYPHTFVFANDFPALRADAVDGFRAGLAAGYAAATGITPDILICSPGDGVGRVALDAPDARR